MTRINGHIIYLFLLLMDNVKLIEVDFEFIINVMVIMNFCVSLLLT